MAEMMKNERLQGRLGTIDSLEEPSFITTFKDAMEAAGIPAPPEIIADGILHRFHVEGDRAGTESGWYVLYGDDPPAGAFGSWKEGGPGDWHKWHFKPEYTLSPAEKAALLAKLEAARAERERLQAEVHAEARERAAEIWKDAEPAPVDHPYLTRKGVNAHGARFYRGSLVLPLRDTAGTLNGLQFIDEAGGKRYLTGSKKTGVHFILGGEPTGMLYVCEGLATGASIHEATRGAVTVAFDAGNLRPVAEALRAKYPGLQFIICGDNDAWSEGNPGATKAREAAAAVGGLVAIPAFRDTTDHPTDFNDLHRLEGLEEVRRQIEAGKSPPEATPFVPSVAFVHREEPMNLWEEPLLFREIETPEISPELLPGWLGEYVAAVAASTQTPTGLGFMLALSVVATCLQKRFEVSPYGDDYREPVNLWTVTALPPASRKTAVFSALTAPLENWEREQEERLRQQITETDFQRGVNQKRIDQLEAKAAKEDNAEERAKVIREMSDLRLATPSELRPPRLWTGNVTPERLQNLLVENGERMAVLTDEGGIFEIMAGLYHDGKVDLDIFLKAHAGTSVRVDRGGREAHLDAPVLTCGLTVQPGIITDFSSGSKKRFRGNGLLARFLYCLPRNNIGTRDVWRRQSIPESVKARYTAGVMTLLDISPQLDESGRERSRILTLDARALDSWLAFSQMVEHEQGPNGEYEHIQDWTGKLPGAALRIAGLFHVVENGLTTEPIPEATMGNALDVAELLIAHAQAAFGLMGTDQATDDAKAIWRWIICRQSGAFTRRECHFAFKGRFTNIERLERALRELQERRIISQPERRQTGGRPSLVYRVNPAVLSEAEHELAAV